MISQLNLDKNEDSFHCLEQTNNKCNWLWQIYIKFVMVGVFFNTVAMSVVSVFISYRKNGHFVTKDSYHPFKFM